MSILPGHNFILVGITTLELPLANLWRCFCPFVTSKLTTPGLRGGCVLFALFFLTDGSNFHFPTTRSQILSPDSQILSIGLKPLLLPCGGMCKWYAYLHLNLHLIRKILFHKKKIYIYPFLRFIKNLDNFPFFWFCLDSKNL